MKRILLMMCICLILLTGCGKLSDKEIVKEIHNFYDKRKGYQLEGELEVTNHDEVYQYDVIVNYMKDDYYKVSLTNVSNQFQQIILKNDDGVFLLTPSLNKSFKFQSDWPYNNSQVYLMHSLLKDIENDSNYVFSRKDSQYIIQTKVNYPNNSSLKTQKLIFDQNYHLKKVTVYDKDDVVCMNFVIKDINLSPKFNKNTFDLDSIVDSSSEKEEATGVIEDVIYPLLLPSGTKLVDEEKVKKDLGERVIMTYDGEKSFLLVEETLDVFKEFTIIPSSGEPFQLMDTIGVMTDNSLSWSSGNMEYYLVSDEMSQQELVDIAQSIVGISSFK